MIYIRVFSIAACTTLCFVANATSALAQYATQVVSYNAGSTAAAGFTTPSVALGSPERFTGEGIFPGVVSPFSPPFGTDEIVSVGEGGQITLRLSNYAVAQPGSTPEIGVFGNVGLVEDYPNVAATSPATAFGVDSSTIEVSDNGINWVSLGNVTIDVPSNGYTDLSDPFSSLPGNALSDFQKPFVGDLTSFNGLPFSDPANPDVLDLLAGSGGGKWLDISGSGLAQVGYIRFSVADNGDPSTALRFVLDAVSVSHAALGVATVPEPTALGLITFALAAAVMRRRRG